MKSGKTSRMMRLADVLGKTVTARNKSPHALSLIASELGNVGAGTLENFAAVRLTPASRSCRR